MNPDFITPKVYGNSLVRLAIENLEKVQGYNDPRASRWKWFMSFWIPWHGLVMAITELCVCDDPSKISLYWPRVEKLYYGFRHLIASSQEGALVEPIEKLMAKVRMRQPCNS